MAVLGVEGRFGDGIGHVEHTEQAPLALERHGEECPGAIELVRGPRALGPLRRVADADRAAMLRDPARDAGPGLDHGLAHDALLEPERRLDHEVLPPALWA